MIKFIVVPIRGSSICSDRKMPKEDAHLLRRDKRCAAIVSRRLFNPRDDCRRTVRRDETCNYLDTFSRGNARHERDDV